MKKRFATALVAASVGALAIPVVAQIQAGPELRVNTYTTSAQQESKLAMGAQGNFVVVWQSVGQDGSGAGIFGQRLGADGTPVGGEFQVNTTTAANQETPAVALFGDGNFIVVWQAMDGDLLGIFAQAFDASGNRQGDESRVNASVAGNQKRPIISSDGGGTSVVVWSDYGRDGHQWGIFGQRFGADGNRMGGEFQINSYTTWSQEQPMVAYDGRGDFVVVWTSFRQETPDNEIFGQRYDATGSRIGGEFQVNSYTPGGQFTPSVAMAADGRFVVSWGSAQDGSNYGIMAQRYDAAGFPLGAEFQANTFTTGFQVVPSIAVDGGGGFVVAWTSANGQDGSAAGVFAQRFDSLGSRRGGEFRVNTYTTGTQDLSGSATIGSDSLGNVVATWRGETQDGSSDGVFTQRFGGLVAAALRVDTDPGGNLVLEPAEAVNVTPSWRNVNGSSQSFGGAAVSFTGPVPATYNILDGSANYGTVANGTTSECSDCYRVGVPTMTRPVLHWDAILEERITPDTQGQDKLWRTHIGSSFTDVSRGNPFYRFIETLLHHSVTGGCGGTQYCPAAATAREQMAVFVLTAKEGAGYVPPACSTPVFGDVPATSPFCRWIEELARRGVVSGCGGGNYCPTGAVTREQMAVFVLRTLDATLNPPACTTPVFADVPASSPFCKWIEELARRSVVTGCGGGNYCPTAAVTREQMGVFISVTFGLTLYGP